MAKKEDITITSDAAELPPSDASAGNIKFPVDVSNGRKVISGYLYVPTDQLFPFEDKRESDFVRHNEVLSDATVQSMKEVGVIEAITVRPKNGTFEILAGESRWRHAMAAGLPEVPCHIVEADDVKARKIFSLTNLLRRDLSYRDKINGWWHYYMAVKESGKINELRNAAKDSDIINALGKDDDKPSYRTIMRFVKLHDLISEWVDELDNGTVTQNAAEHIAAFPEPIQKELLQYKIDADQAIHLKKIFEGQIEGQVWGPETIPSVLGKKIDVREKLTKKQADKTPVPEAVAHFQKARKKILSAAQSVLRVEDYSRADQIISAALKLYYEQMTLEDTSPAGDA